jgi:putative transposase
VPRARLNTSDSKTTEWKSQSLRAYQRRTLAAFPLLESTPRAWRLKASNATPLFSTFAGAIPHNPG